MNPTTILVKDANGNLQTINTTPNPGQALSAASSPVVLASDQSAVSVSDSQSAPISGAIAMTVGTAYTTQRGVGVLCTVAGNVELQFPDNSTLTLPVYAGWQTFPFAVTMIVAAGTTATATYYGLK